MATATLTPKPAAPTAGKGGKLQTALFQVRAGCGSHYQVEIVGGVRQTVEINGQDGKPKMAPREVRYRATLQAPSEPFESDQPLDQRWPEKFLRVNDSGPRIPTKADRAAERALAKMSDAQLREIAAEEEIDVEGLKTKDELLAAIREAKQLATAE